VGEEPAGAAAGFGPVTFDSGYPGTNTYTNTVIQDIFPMGSGFGSGIIYPMPFGTTFPADLPLTIAVTVACLHCMPGSSIGRFNDSMAVQPFQYHPPYAKSAPYIFKP
jgi:hypothetical protein